MFSLYMISMAIEKGVESMLEKEKVDFIKIEGKVSSEARKTLVDRFQPLQLHTHYFIGPRVDHIL